MKSMKKMAMALAAIGLVSASGLSSATPALRFTDSIGVVRTLDPFGGFDYISNATAVADALNFDGTTVMTTTYLASANAVLNTIGDPFFTPGLIPPAGPANPYEFTVKATIFETATCNFFVAPGVCGQATFVATGGSYQIYFDKTADANRGLGTGYLDGTLIISGSILPGVAGAFTLNATADGGSGNFSFFGNVGFTETDCSKDACINPALLESTAGAELKIGRSTTSWVAPTTWVDGGGIQATDLVFQADGNQSFTAAPVPEPASLALVGLSLVGLAATRRRRAK